MHSALKALVVDEYLSLSYLLFCAHHRCTFMFGGVDSAKQHFSLFLRDEQERMYEHAMSMDMMFSVQGFAVNT